MLEACREQGMSRLADRARCALCFAMRAHHQGSPGTLPVHNSVLKRAEACRFGCVCAGASAGRHGRKHTEAPLRRRLGVRPSSARSAATRSSSESLSSGFLRREPLPLPAPRLARPIPRPDRPDNPLPALDPPATSIPTHPGGIIINS